MFVLVERTCKYIHDVRFSQFNYIFMINNTLCFYADTLFGWMHCQRWHSNSFNTTEYHLQWMQRNDSDYNSSSHFCSHEDGQHSGSRPWSPGTINLLQKHKRIRIYIGLFQEWPGLQAYLEACKSCGRVFFSLSWVYIYIYIYRERERERDIWWIWKVSQ